jgi:hypothetical protein
MLLETFPETFVVVWSEDSIFKLACKEISLALQYNKRHQMEPYLQAGNIMLLLKEALVSFPISHPHFQHS